MEEIWKDIKGYEGLYMISSYGNVKSLNYKGTGREGILTPFIDNREGKGYLRVTLCKNGKKKRFQVHRLVAEAFIPNPHNLPEVNHKSEIKSQNNVENLEWCDAQYNMNYGTARERTVEKTTNGKLSRQVFQYDLDNNLINVFPSGKEVQRKLGYLQGNISSCCLGRLKTYKGFIWRYKEESVA